MKENEVAVPAYRHTQPGWVILGVLGVILALLRLGDPRGFQGAAPSLLFTVVAALFGALTVSVDGETLRARFGLGLIWKTIRLRDVVSCEAVTNEWIWGWGIRLIPGGWLLNVSGLEAVEVRLRDGRAYRIGTDEPEALVAALRAHLGSPPPAATERARTGGGRGPQIAAGAVVLLILASVGGAAALTAMETRPAALSLAGDSLSVRSLVYSVEVPLRDVRQVSLEPRLPALRRTGGFAAGGVLHGHFESPALGSGYVFADTAQPPFLLVRTQSGFLLVGEDAARTRALHDELRPAWDRIRVAR